MTTTAEDVKARWGQLLQRKREEAEETQRQLADRLGCDPITISRAERGLGSFERYLEIATALGVELVGES